MCIRDSDDPFIIAGQGTAGLEIAQSGIDFDALITCMGGGGLCAGISLVMNKLSPSTKIYGAEPEHYNDHQMSLDSGQRERLTKMPQTLCDALMTPQPGELTWPINSKSLSGVFDVPIILFEDGVGLFQAAFQGCRQNIARSASIYSRPRQSF